MKESFVLVFSFLFMLSAGNVYSRSEISSSGVIEVESVKHPGAHEWGEPVMTKALRPLDPLKGFNQLLPYVFASPNQEDAGSCLYMALTGNVEWWLSRMYPKVRRAPDGPIDLSERYLMNLAGLEEDSNGIKEWRTDSIYLYNKSGIGIKNTHFRYTKGWYKYDKKKKEYVTAKESEEGASYGTPFNWIDTRNQITPGGEIPLPRFSRKIIFKDPESNQWNVGISPKNIVFQVKDALRTKKAPVMVMYNHYGYWHVVLIVGYDDKGTTKGCGFTKGTVPYLAEKAVEYQEEADRENDPEKKKKILKKAKRYKKLSQNLKKSWEERGGCRDKGVFYVRDSLYPDPKAPIYDYDPSQNSDDAPYTKKVILREYEWLENLSNHVIQIYPRRWK